ncbi:Hypothetical protein SMAX5B_013676 [Scophthalmus maximus]|uniref:Uncharacterized protein n=1 Tax=Scophthalmus maximus TaxID=52904 RepID=A0A2U9AZZ7_SCOMX|nr:Hypothetical protein SMAX5B_013676 [Scophthalmus maximus]
MPNLTAPGGSGDSNVTCSCNCTAAQPQGMEICEYRPPCVCPPGARPVPAGPPVGACVCVCARDFKVTSTLPHTNFIGTF